MRPHESYGSEGEFIKKGQDHVKMANGNGSGKTPYEAVLKVLQPIIVIGLALVGWGIRDIGETIKSNASILRTVEGTQIRVVESIRRIESDLQEHEMKTERETRERGVYHHTEMRSCMTCKTRPDYDPPSMKYRNNNTFPGK